MNLNDIKQKNIDVSSHGILPNTDITLKLSEILTSIEGMDNATLDFPKGIYKISRKYAFESYKNIANHDDGLKRIAFYIKNLNGLTINGNGSSFIFYDEVIPFAIEDSSNVTLKNFSVDFIMPFHSELEVVSSDLDKKSFTAKINAELYPYKIENNQILFKRFEQWVQVGQNIVFDKKTTAPILNAHLYETKNYPHAIDLGNDLVEFSQLGDNALPIPVGGIWITYGERSLNRNIPGIHIIDCKNIILENITIHTAGGMSLIVERTENIKVSHYSVTPSHDRIVSTRADATHFMNCKGDIIVENCQLDHMLDDGINVHGAYVNIDSYIGNNTFLASISHFQQEGIVFADPGDKVAFTKKETISSFFETTVKEVKAINSKVFLISFTEIPEELPSFEMTLENLTWQPNVIFKNNTIEKNRARGALTTTKGKVEITDNYFNNQMHSVLLVGDNDFWYESSGTQDVTIRNNVFDQVGFSDINAYPLYALVKLTENQKHGIKPYHGHISFIDNKINSLNGLLAYSSSVGSLTIENNSITSTSTTSETISESPTINLISVNSASIKNNQSVNFITPRLIKREKVNNLINESNIGFNLI
ncbi:right-handed parallel beta-helix repeat-containing protein [Marinomonas flavescens]|uniref:alpha-1,3-galactosidase-related protein n=1 Tax=Marinomonas flavescens TaxID=2529379 RepID=UPI001054FFB5|nr:right-handed parallel beta-helix repeat-containing protein [Marinomonas flavescens]